MVYPARYRDHPRMCGEKKSFANSIEMELGSPPHVRGKGTSVFRYFFHGRITPACAGKRRCKAASCELSWDHPRMCGEKKCCVNRSLFVWGSPPHVRGKEIYAFCFSRGYGITPACAGKRNWQCSTMKAEKDHPRMCGEKQWPKEQVWFITGSPPHVRGKD